VVVPSVTDADGGMEGIPVVIMEAMSLGVAVIATQHSGIPEVVTSETGTLVPERDAMALALAIESFQFDVPRLERARALVEAEFDIDKVVDTRLRLFSA
jgi:colanic acid/amylovoran biosynthesis glycosyltransferase